MSDNGWVSVSPCAPPTTYLPLTGGTLTGPVYVSSLVEVDGVGATPLAPNPTATAAIRLNKAVSGFSNNFNGYMNGLFRWQIIMGNSTAESGSNAGSDFVIACYNDAGVGLFQPIQITRATGAVQIYGTSTNDNAAAGYVGEVVSSVIASPGVTLTTSVVSNITSISLTPGDWDVSGDVWIAVGTGAPTSLNGAISTTAIGLGSGGLGTSRCTLSATFAASTVHVLSLRTCRVSIASTSTQYLNASVTFPSGTTTAYGNIWARRAR